MARAVRAIVMARVMVSGVGTAGGLLLAVGAGDALARRGSTLLIIMTNSDHGRKEHDNEHDDC